MTVPAPPPMSAHELELDDSWAYGAGTLHGGWLLETVHAGWLDEQCVIRDSAGQLAAQARQLAGSRQP